MTDASMPGPRDRMIIALRLHVAERTVSRAYTGGYVSQRMRQRIAAVAHEIGCPPPPPKEVARG